MNDDSAKQGYAATPHMTLMEQLLDSRVPKTEREHAAAREIERLRASVVSCHQEIYARDALLRQALEALENAIAIRNCEGGTKYGPDIEQPAIAALRERLAADDARVDAEVQLRFLNRMIAAKRLNKGEEK